MLKLTNDTGDIFYLLDWRYLEEGPVSGKEVHCRSLRETQSPTLPAAFENLGHASLCAPFVCQAGHKKQNQVPGS